MFSPAHDLGKTAIFKQEHAGRCLPCLTRSHSIKCVFSGSTQESASRDRFFSVRMEESPQIILGYESSTTQIRTLADVMDFLFKLETVEGIDFKINVQKPPRSKQWECSVSFDGKSTAEFNADMCLFLEQWEDERSELRAYNSTQAAYKRWKEQTLAYYAANAVKCTEPEELDRDELIARRTELLEKEYGNNESNE